MTFPAARCRFCTILYSLALLLLLSETGDAQSPEFDIWISGGHIVDGSGSGWFRGEVGIRGDEIVYVGPADARPDWKQRALRKLKASGFIVAPGFIDTHSHGRRGVFDVPSAENQIRQGVTTIIEGPDGSSPLPVGEFLARFSKVPASTNFGLLVGQGSIREKVIGLSDRKATPEELERMVQMVRTAMREGAFGISTGLFYIPGAFTPTEEVVALSRAAAEAGGIYTSHMRNEAAQVVEAVKETIRIGEAARIPVQVTHHKIIGRANWGLSKETVRLVEEARARGIDATIDQYPYTASSTGLAALFPKWALESGQAAFKERAAAPASRARMRAAIATAIEHDRGAGDPKNVVVASCGFDRSLAGRTLADITRLRNREVNFANAAETAIEMQEKGGCSCIYHAISEEDIERIMRYPFTMVASDGGIPFFGVDVPHPRSYGTFARVLGRYVRERKVLVLEEAIRRMTSLPATRFRIMDRGLLRPGMKADIAVFDATKVIDKADFANPHQYAEGFVHVLVNGKLVLDSGKMTSARPGRALYGPGHRPSGKS